MAFPYEYSPQIWPMVASAACSAVLMLYAIRRRAVPGAIPFVVLGATIILWSLASALRLSATDDGTRILWFKFEAALLLTAVSTELCFAIQYAGLGKWLTRRTLVLLTLAPLGYSLLILTNDVHRLVWTRIWFDGYVRAGFGPANWYTIAYGYSLSLIQLAVLIQLFSRSPRHRWIVGALVLTLFIVRGSFIARVMNWDQFATIDPVAFAMPFAILPYALAFFRFHIFDAVPVARDTIIERMPEGMMVVDARNRVLDLNETAQNLLGVIRSQAIGSPVVEVLHVYPRLLEMFRSSVDAQEEIPIGDANTRWVQVTLSPLIDRRGFHLGRLILLRDITLQRRAQEQVLDQQRTLAVLKERELLGRELHDGIGQLLAAAQLQARSASALLSKGDTAMVEHCLKRIADATQEAKESIRTYLHGVEMPFQQDQGLLPMLRQYITRYRQDYGVSVDLTVSPELEGKRIGATVEAQLLPIIREALTNVRRHGGGCSARVNFASDNGRVQATVEDDGCGFNPEKLGNNQGFGIRSMRGRAESIGGFLEVSSAAGKGTRVTVRVPWRKEEP